MKKIHLLCWMLLGALAIASEAATTLLPTGSVWRFWDKGSEPVGWKSPSYVEPGGSPWGQGPGELGYGDGDETTIVSYGPNSSSKYITTYFRRSVVIPNPSAFSAINLKLWRDDGAVVYVNGVEVARYTMPTGTVTYSTLATSAIEETISTIALSPSVFVSGTNWIAVEMHQANGTSTDISFDLELTGQGQVIRGPYLQMGTADSIIVRWRTATATQSIVRYGTNPDSATWTSTGTTTATTEHQVLITGLTANQSYYYSVGNSAGPLASGADYIFYTAPPTATASPTRIWVLGDSGTGDANAAAVRNAYFNYASTQYTDLLLMLGDNAYEAGLDGDYQVAVFDMYPEILRQTVLWPTIGNHDTAQATTVDSSLPYFQMFTLPTGAEAGGVPSGTEKYYAFNYGNVHFVCLDSMTSSRLPGSAMLTWLDSDLANNTLPWVIAFWHHPPYSKGSHDSDVDIELREMRQNVLPILDAYNVDLVLGGHSHAYERSVLLNGHYGNASTITPAMKLDSGSGRDNASGSYNKTTGAPNAHEGAVYIVAGSSGKISGGALNHPAMFISLNLLGSLVIDVNGNKLDVKFLRETGAISDYFSIVKENQRPTASVTSPQNGSSLSNPNVSITADAQDADGSVTEVAFYGDNTLLGTDTSAPYEFSWSSLSLGSHTVSVQARDDKGVTTSSATVSFTITAPVPPAPANLQANATSTSQIALTWSDLSSNEDGFKIERSADGTNFSLLIQVAANATSYTDSGLTANTLYYYRVSAFNASGSSGPSNIASATTPDTAPSAPASLQANALSSSQIGLTWSDLSSNETGFKIQRSTDGSNFSEVGQVAANATTYTDTGLNPNTLYYYRVTAFNAAGSSTPSNIASAQTQDAAPTAPGNLQASAVSSSQIALTWSDLSSNENGFKIERSTDGSTFSEIGQVASNVTSYSDSGLNPATLYYYRVIAFNAVASSAPSNIASAQTLDVAPNAPANLQASTVSNSQIALSWSDLSSNETGFRIERSTDGISFSVAGQVAANATGYTDSGLNPNTLYHYRVAAFNAAGSSAPSNIASAQTLDVAPIAPANLQASALSTSQIALTWSDSSANETGFIIERSTDGLTFSPLGQVAANATSFIDSGLNPATLYYYRVAAFNAIGTSATSNVASAQTLDVPPSAPASLQANAVSSSQIALTWSDLSANETGFRIERSTDGINFSLVTQVAANATSYTNSGLSPNTLYYYRITAFNTAGSSAPSNTASAQTLDSTPAAPTNLAATAVSKSQINLTWIDNSSNETGFRIERKSGPNGQWSLLTNVPAGTTSYSNTGLSSNTSYTYRVLAFNAVGQSAWSNEDTAKTPKK